MDIIRRDRAKSVAAQPGLVRRVLAHRPAIMLVENTIAAGTTLPMHQHPHEQILYVQQGDLRLDCQGRQQLMHAGDSCAIPGDVPHQVTTVTEVVVLDIFAPAREDFLAQS